MSQLLTKVQRYLFRDVRRIVFNIIYNLVDRTLVNTAIGGIIRPMILRAFGFKVGRNTKIADNVTISFDTVIGNNCYINKNAIFDGTVIIGDNVEIGMNCVFVSNSHELKASVHGRRPNVKTSPITIEDNVWLASNVIVLAGVLVGKNSVVGAASVVTKDVAPGVLAYGSPAKTKYEII